MDQIKVVISIADEICGSYERLLEILGGSNYFGNIKYPLNILEILGLGSANMYP